MNKELERHDVEEWIRNIPTGEFHYKGVLDGKVTPGSYDKLRKIMHYITHAKDPICEPVGKRDGYYRPVQRLPETLDWQSAGSRQQFPLILPFNLREYVWIYPNTVTVVGGSKSSGKTGFLYRTIVLNMGKVNIILLSNMEGGIEQMRDRFDVMGVEIPNPAPWRTLRVDSNFHDFIKEPNTLYVIDYITAPEDEYWKIGTQITKIQRKLENSVAVVGLQKPFNRDIAVGGEGTLRDATLYLALNKNKLKIVDAKVPNKPTVNPTNMQWTFLYDKAGTDFINIQRTEDKPSYAQEG